MRIENPLVIMFQAPDGNLICHLHPPKDYTHAHYGLAVCDLVRHIAKAFKIGEDEVWKWVDQERDHPTTDVKQAQ